MIEELTSDQAAANQPDSAKKSCLRKRKIIISRSFNSESMTSFMQTIASFIQAIASVIGVIILWFINAEIDKLKIADNELRSKISKIEETANKTKFPGQKDISTTLP